MTSLIYTQEQPARPSLSAVPLFTVFGDPGATPPRPGRVRSGFSLAGGGPPALHVVGAGDEDRDDDQVGPEDVSGEADADWSVAASCGDRASKRFLDGHPGCRCG